MAEPPITLTAAARRLTEQGDPVDRSTLSRYVKNHAADLKPEKAGNGTVVDFDRLLAHRRVHLGRRTSEAFGEDVDFGRERALKTRFERLRIQLANAETEGVVVPVRDVENAAHAAVGMMRNALANAAGDTAEAVAKALGREANLVRPHVRQFERAALAYFVADLRRHAEDPA